MTMRKTFIATAIVAVLSCSAAQAQVLGGGVGGAVNGALGGGLRDTSVFSEGNANGSFGGELDTGSMIHRTRGAAEQTTQRARNVGTNVRNRTESTVAATRDKSAKAATSATSATSAAASSAAQPEPKKLDVAPKVAADASASASVDSKKSDGQK